MLYLEGRLNFNFRRVTLCTLQVANFSRWTICKWPIHAVLLSRKIVHEHRHVAIRKFPPRIRNQRNFAEPKTSRFAPLGWGGFPSRPILHVVVDRIFFSISHQPRQASTQPHPRGNCAPFYPPYVLCGSHIGESGETKRKCLGNTGPPAGLPFFRHLLDSRARARVHVHVSVCSVRASLCVRGALLTKKPVTYPRVGKKFVENRARRRDTDSPFLFFSFFLSLFSPSTVDSSVSIPRTGPAWLNFEKMKKKKERKERKIPLARLAEYCCRTVNPRDRPCVSSGWRGIEIDGRTMIERGRGTTSCFPSESLHSRLLSSRGFEEPLPWDLQRGESAAKSRSLLRLEKCFRFYSDAEKSRERVL